MSRLQTHYVNLQVIETASPEVIKGAYKHLCQKWHPDKHPNQRAEAERITKLLNEAYDVLSDAEKRRAHDAWIAAQRLGGTSAASESNEEPSPETQLPRSTTFMVAVVLTVYFVALFQFWGWVWQALDTIVSPSAPPTPTAMCRLVTKDGHIQKDGTAQISVVIQNDGADGTVLIDAGINVGSGRAEKSQKLRVKSGELKSVEFSFTNVARGSHDMYWFRCTPQN
ncbi:J domain-containing protein [Cupriavidus sp. 2MCAB6]|uniref:J domain-containing protein n=1 Tax=Cupriavidus sp. 2MCAB6 TaxID=3232981 RepID=UPI003F91EA5F